MDTVEQTFIVGVWREECVDERQRVTWQGSITHVPTGAKHYLASLSDIISFITPYLESMGLKPGLRLRAMRWLKRWKPW